MRFIQLLWITTRPGRAWVGSVTNKHNPSTESGLGACISSRITTVIHVWNDHQINCNCFNEPFAVSPYRSLYWDMHGLIFETSIWLLAGSTRFVHNHRKGAPALRSSKPAAHISAVTKRESQEDSALNGIQCPANKPALWQQRETEASIDHSSTRCLQHLQQCKLRCFQLLPKFTPNFNTQQILHWISKQCSTLLLPGPLPNCNTQSANWAWNQNAMNT